MRKYTRITVNFEKGQIHEHVFAQTRGFCVYFPTYILQRAWKSVFELLTVWCMGCFLVWLYEQTFPSSVTMPNETLSRLEWKFSEDLSSWTWKLGDILRYNPVLAGKYSTLDVFRPIACKKNYLMNHNCGYSFGLSQWSWGRFEMKTWRAGCK